MSSVIMKMGRFETVALETAAGTHAFEAFRGATSRPEHLKSARHRLTLHPPDTVSPSSSLISRQRSLHARPSHLAGLEIKTKGSQSSRTAPLGPAERRSVLSDGAVLSAEMKTPVKEQL